MKSIKKRIILTSLSLFALAAGTQAALLAEFNAATAGAGTLPDDVSPAWSFAGGGPLMTNNGSYLLQDYESEDYGNWTMGNLPAGTLNVGVHDYGISTTMRPITTINWGQGSAYANIFLQWQDTEAFYGFTFWKDGGSINYGPGGSGLIAGIDWDVAHTFFIGYNSGDDTFSFFLDGSLRTVQPRTQFILGANFDGPNRVSFGDMAQYSGPSGAEWYDVSIYNTAAPVPEPSAFLLVALGGVLLWKASHRRKQAC